MNDDLQSPVSCRFRYTTSEYRRAIGLRTRATPARGYLFCLIPLALLGLLLYPQAAADYRATFALKGTGQAWHAAFSDMEPLVFVFIGVGLLFTPIGGLFYGLFFRGQINHNRDVEWILSPTGIHYSSDIGRSDLAWAAVQRARENSNGFLLQIGRRQFIWFSAQGSESPVARNDARQMIRTFVRDFKSYGVQLGS